MGQHAILTWHGAAKAKEMTLSHEGGEVHQVDPMTVVRRFLVLGSTGTFYANRFDVTKLATGAVETAIKESPDLVLGIVNEIEAGNLALRRDPMLWTLARLTMPDVPIASRRNAAQAVARICRTGTELLHWIAYRRSMGGSNRTFRRAVANWFTSRSADDLALQAVKYDARDGWSMRDALRLARPTAPTSEHDLVFGWMAHPERRSEFRFRDPVRLFSGYALLREDTKPIGPSEIIRANRLPREAVPGELLQHREVWEALLPDMPAMALVRNLGKLTSLGVTFNGESSSRTVEERIIRAADKLHPFHFLIAAKTYAQGHGVRGKLVWKPHQNITDALMSAFGIAFGHLPVYADKYPLIALDASSSMRQPAGDTPLSCHEAEAALAMVFAHQFPNAAFMRFSHRLEAMDIHGRPFDDVFREVQRWDGGGTHCDLPLLLAEGTHRATDVIMVTDSETWHARETPSRVVERIHRNGRSDFRFACVAMATNDISVADDRDPMQMNFVGMSADMPRAVGSFLVGEA
jgi:60 kDa SS-A/Ro ribonucleoprotein